MLRRPSPLSAATGMLLVGALLLTGGVAPAAGALAPAGAGGSTVPPTTEPPATSAPTTTTVPPTAAPTTTIAPTTAPTTTVAATTTQPPTPTTTPTTTVPCVPVTTTTTLPPGASTTTSTTTTTSPDDPTTTTRPPGPPCPTTTTTTTTTVAPATTIAPPVAAPSAPAPLGVPVPGDLAYILLTIRTLESGGRYGIGPNKGNASGAYQYIASTWNNFGGYPHAYLAPPEVQDQRALGDVQSILRTWNGDVSMIPVIWYYPKAASNPEIMDQVPLPQFGNRLTVREYQRRWLQILGFITGDPSAYALAIAPPGLEFLSGLPPALTPSWGDLQQIAFPVLGSAVVAPPQPCGDDACEGGTSAIVYGQTLQPVLAAVDGVVTSVEVENAVSGAVTLTITDAAGRTFHYAGFNDDIPGEEDGEGAAPESLRFTALGQVGTPVKAGQIIGYMGDTDPMPSDENRGTPTDAVWPHIRLTIRDAQGVRLETDALVVQAQADQACHVGIGPWATPADPRLTARGDNPRRRSTIEVDAILNGGWTLHADGTVTAYGKSALIAAPQGCEWAPEDPFGPGASGNQPDLAWWVPAEIPTRYWVSASVATGGVTPVGLFPRG